MVTSCCHFSLSLDQGTGTLVATIRDDQEQLVRCRDVERLSLEKWHHVSVTSDGEKLMLYRDGQPVSSIECSAMTKNTVLRHDSLNSVTNKAKMKKRLFSISWLPLILGMLLPGRLMAGVEYDATVPQLAFAAQELKGAIIDAQRKDLQVELIIRSDKTSPEAFQIRSTSTPKWRWTTCIASAWIFSRTIRTSCRISTRMVTAL
jgi:hypothetical protein